MLERTMKQYLEPFLKPDIVREVSWMDETPLWSAPFGIKLLDTIRMKRGSTVLDIGFGFGFPLIEIAFRLGGDSKVVGIDPWDLAMQKTQQKLTALGVKNIELIQGDAESIPYPEGTFDLITSNNGINNVADLPKCLSECYRVSKPGGQFVFTMNTEETMIEFYRVLQQVLKERSLPDSIASLKKHIHEKRKPKEEIKDRLAQAGFRITNILDDSFVFRYADATVMLNHYFIREGFLPSWVKIVPHEKLEIIFDEVERRLNDAAEREGELRLTIPFLTFDCKK